MSSGSAWAMSEAAPYDGIEDPDGAVQRRHDPDRPPPPPGRWLLTPLGPRGRPGAPDAPSAPIALPGAAGIGLSLGAIAVYLVGQLLLQFGVGIGLVGTGLVGPDLLDPEADSALLLALVVASQLFGLLLALAFLRWRGVGLRPMVGHVRPLGRLVGQGVGLGLAAIVGSTLIVSLLVALTGSDAAPDQVLTGRIADTPMQLVLAVVAAVVLAPLAEELLFRGLLHRGLRRRFALAPATVVSSVLFALVHIDVVLSQPLALVGLVLVGVILAIAYERTGSLIVPVVIHAVHNAVTIVAVVVTARFDLDTAAPGVRTVVGLLRSVA
jgi:membrane protease YdiL (CAAX protease family)